MGKVSRGGQFGAIPACERRDLGAWARKRETNGSRGGEGGSSGWT